MTQSHKKNKRSEIVGADLLIQTYDTEEKRSEILEADLLS